MKHVARTCLSLLLIGFVVLLAPQSACAGLITGPTFVVDTPTGVIVTYTGDAVADDKITIFSPEVSPITGAWTTAPTGLFVAEFDDSAGLFDLVRETGSLSRNTPGATPFSFLLEVAGTGSGLPLTDMDATTIAGEPYSATLVATPGPGGSISGWTLTLTAGTPGVVPEPGSLTLLGLGALGVVGFAWRRRRLTA